MAHIRVLIQPFTRAIATSAIYDDDLVGPVADQLPHLRDQQAHKEKRIVTHGHDTYWPGHAPLFTEMTGSAKESNTKCLQPRNPPVPLWSTTCVEPLRRWNSAPGLIATFIWRKRSRMRSSRTCRSCCQMRRRTW